MKEIRGLLPDELKTEILAIGEKAFRAQQIFSWLHEKRAENFSEMTNLSAALREKLAENYTIGALRIETVQTSALDGTKKYLLALPDGNMIESVLMRYHYGNSVCVSTQVGCRMGCRFCASTIGGLVRNLTASEILGEIYAIERDCGERISHCVLMGSGEPMDNYDEVVRFLRLITDPSGYNMSIRNITVSTCGIPEKIREFADEKLPVTLALSLHAADDETRKELMPIARTYPLSEVLSACDFYFEKTGRRVSYEYSVVAGVNDHDAEAEKLAALLHGKNAHVNLIPVNPVTERHFERPSRERVEAFQKTLVKNGIHATIRRELGTDIDGACGQLRIKHLRDQEKGGAS